MQRVRNASAASLMPFVEESVEPGSVVHTDGWLGYEPLEKKGYQHRIVFLSGRRKQASELLPRVHQAISLLKRWLLGTHQGAVSHEHLDYYLDEFVSLQPAQLTQPGKTLLPPCAAGSGRGPNAVSIDRRRLGRRGPVSPTTRCWGHLNEVDTPSSEFPSDG